MIHIVPLDTASMTEANSYLESSGCFLALDDMISWGLEFLLSHTDEPLDYETRAYRTKTELESFVLEMSGGVTDEDWPNFELALMAAPIVAEACADIYDQLKYRIDEIRNTGLDIAEHFIYTDYNAPRGSILVSEGGDRYERCY